MHWLSGRTTLVLLAAAGLLTCSAGSAVAGQAAAPASVAKWTKISTGTGLGLASAGLYRTADGRLHVAWARKDGTTYSMHYSTIGSGAKLLNTGTIVSKWAGVSFYPRLIAAAKGGMRLVFSGGNGKNGSPYDLGAMYSATSGSAGMTWTLAPGALSHSGLVSLTDDAAVAEPDGTPVASWAAGDLLDYHIGISPTVPDPNPDHSVSVGAGSVVIGPTLARAKDGSIAVAWFTSSGQANQGYWVDQILPTSKGKVKAPGSGGKNLGNNQPLEAVAFTARVGGGEYLAYCVPTKILLCGHIALWRVGAAKAVTVPGSATGQASHVAIAASPGGYLWIGWFDSGMGKIRLVRTSAAATKFGAVRTIAAPPKLGILSDVQIEASKGAADVIALMQQNVPSASPLYWDTQVKP